MRDYDSRAKDRLFIKCEADIKKNVKKLMYTTGYQQFNEMECLQEMTILFFQHFEEYYETDRQYLSFLFICMKNKIRNFQRRDIKHQQRYTTDLSQIRYGLGVGSQSDQDSGSSDIYKGVWGNVADPSDIFSQIEIAEIMRNARSSMDVHQEEMFTLIVEDGSLVEEMHEICKLRRVINPSPPQKSRLTVLEKRKGHNGLTLKETVNFVQESLRPLLESNKLLDGLFA